MRTPLKKTDYLLQLESVLKKYGYTEMYCREDEVKFDGSKKGGLSFVINADSNDVANTELNKIVDPTWGLDDYDWRDMSGVSICRLTGDAVSRLGVLIYSGGEFFASEG